MHFLPPLYICGGEEYLVWIVTIQVVFGYVKNQNFFILNSILL